MQPHDQFASAAFGVKRDETNKELFSEVVAMSHQLAQRCVDRLIDRKGWPTDLDRLITQAHGGFVKDQPDQDGTERIKRWLDLADRMFSSD